MEQQLSLTEIIIYIRQSVMIETSFMIILPTTKNNFYLISKLWFWNFLAFVFRESEPYKVFHSLI